MRALLRFCVLHLPYPALPRCVPCSVPGHLLPADAGIRLLCPVPVTSGRKGARRRRRREI
ncbi:unnamed protein product [Staurois parvus]|uniref:Uncharacterized protein n=1 Tax=Staurois parvus TaxID=386267 RepID=A0ABN9BGR0_9NEOB|nr:unnamed protein product [Staurois parvus]